MATPLQINILDDDAGCWDDIDPARVTEGTLERVAFIRNGTAQGRATVMVLIRLPDGSTVAGETTWRLFNTAARALAASPAAAEET